MDQIIDVTKKQFDKLTITTYFKNKRNNQRENEKIHKFIEALWRFLFYSIIFFYGIDTLILSCYKRTGADLLAHEECFVFFPNDGYPPKHLPAGWTMNCWIGWPLYGNVNTPLTSTPLYCYYIMGLGIYIHQLMHQFSPINIRHKDFLEMTLHHVSTILLVTFSFLSNWTRIGVIIFLLHDVADVILEFSKLLFYHAHVHIFFQRATDVMFGVFTLTFFGTRLVFLPFVVLVSTIKEAAGIFGWENQAMFGLNSLLIILQILHIYWFCLIVRMIFRLLKTGKVEGDIRSEDEE